MEIWRVFVNKGGVHESEAQSSTPRSQSKARPENRPLLGRGVQGVSTQAS